MFVKLRDSSLKKNKKRWKKTEKWDEGKSLCGNVQIHMERGGKTHSFLASMTYWVSKQHRCLWELLQLHEIDVQKRKKKKKTFVKTWRNTFEMYRTCPEFHWHLKSLVPHLGFFWIFTVHIYGNIKEKSNKKKQSFGFIE